MQASVFPDFQYATGCRIRPADLAGQGQYCIDVRAEGAGEKTDPGKNTAIINAAIARAAARAAGGTVVIPAGEYSVYTIFLRSHVTLYLQKGAVLRAAELEEGAPGTEADAVRVHDREAAPDLQERNGADTPGNFAEPEVNIYNGIQDHGHSYLRNALIFGEGLENVAILGPGLLDGSALAEDGTYRNVLHTDDPANPEDRLSHGDQGLWFGNKGIALRRCRNVILQDFSIVHGGHFAIICCAVENLYVDHILCDTDRDAFDIDGCRDVTVVNSTFNSLCDDGLCLKSDYGAGDYYPARNVYIENCLVCGYDPGSVYDGTWSRNRLIAPDRCGPTGRVKFGTESSCGYDTVIIRKVHFLRSRGFCMEAVDTSPMHDVLMEDCLMEDISSAPIYIRVGDRARFAVTGIHKDTKMHHSEDVRLDSTQWIVPQNAHADVHSGAAGILAGETQRSRGGADDSAAEGPAAGTENESSRQAIFRGFPAARYTPSYRRDQKMELDPGAPFAVVNPENPARVNPANYSEQKGRYYALRWEETQQTYVTDGTREIPRKDLPLYGNAVGRSDYASAWNIEIRNVTIRDVDPRYPIVIHGLEQSRIRNLFIHDITVEFRGGMTKRMAVEQRQLNTVRDFRAWKAPVRHQILPWQVNTFFCQNEALLPRIRWDAEQGHWVDDPYNVPEMPEVYPESSNWGILPAYGIYARHVENLTLENIRIRTDVADERDAIVLQDSHKVRIAGVLVENGRPESATKRGSQGQDRPAGQIEKGSLILVDDPFGRRSGREYLPGEERIPTQNQDITADNSLIQRRVVLAAPAPGTPPDEVYPWPTMPSKEHPYHYAEPIGEVTLPRTVYRPYAEITACGTGSADTAEGNCRIRVVVHDPASDQGQARGELADACPPGKNPAVGCQRAEIVTSIYAVQGEKRIRIFSTSEREFTVEVPRAPEKDAEQPLLECVVDDGIRREIYRQTDQEEAYGRREEGLVGHRRFVHLSE